MREQREPADDSESTSLSTAPVYVGYCWLIRSVEEAGRTVQIPVDLVAADPLRGIPSGSIAFLSSGDALLDDMCNIHNARFTYRSTTLSFSDIRSSLAYFDRSDPLRTVVVDAIASLTSGRQVICAEVEAETLLLSTPQLTMTLSRTKTVLRLR